MTGADGFIGRHVLDALAEQSWEIYALRAPFADQVRSTDGVHWLTADLLSGLPITELEEIRASYLIHLAWASNRDVYESDENNRWVQASQTLLETFTQSGGRRAVLAGSCAEYDWSVVEEGELLAERTAVLAGDTAYAASKLELLRFFESLVRSKSLSGAWARIFFLYGPYEHPDRLVPAVIRALLAGLPAETTHGRQIRDYLHVRDVAAALVALLGSNLEGPINIGSGLGVRLADLVGTIASILDRTHLLRIGALPAPSHEGPAVVADVSRLTNELGWRPRLDLDRGLAATIEWWRRFSGESEAESERV